LKKKKYMELIQEVRPVITGDQCAEKEFACSGRRIRRSRPEGDRIILGRDTIVDAIRNSWCER